MAEIFWREPQQERARVVFSSIAKAGFELFPKLGFEETTTNKIAERAGVNVSSLYQYFKNKESILTFLVESFIEESRAGVRDVAEKNKKESFSHFIDSLVKFSLDRYNTHNGFLKVMYETAGILKTASKIFLIRKDIAADLVEIIAESYPELAARQGSVDNIELIINSFMGVIQSQAICESKEDLRQTQERMKQLILSQFRLN